MCSACKNTWDADPLGLMSRYSGGNRQSLCKSCWFTNKKIHESVINGTKSFQFINPSNPNGGMGGLSAPPPCLGSMSDLRLRHEEEMLRRIRWCLDNNYLPAYDHIHLAPGDDSQFMVRFCFKYARGIAVREQYPVGLSKSLLPLLYQFQVVPLYL